MAVMFKQLGDMAPGDFFVSIKGIPQRISQSRTILWGLAFMAWFFQGVGSMGVLSSNLLFPDYAWQVNSIVLCLCSAYTLLCVPFSFKQIASRLTALYLTIAFLGLVCVQLSIWCLTMLLVLTQGDSPLFLFLIAATLLSAAAINLVVLRRTVRRVVQGHYRQGGNGFFNAGDSKMRSLNDKLSFFYPCCGHPPVCGHYRILTLPAGKPEAPVCEPCGVHARCLARAYHVPFSPWLNFDAEHLLH